MFRTLVLAGLAIVACLIALPALAQNADEFRAWYAAFCSANPDMVSFWATVAATVVGALGLGGLASHSPLIRSLFGSKVAIAALMLTALAACSGDPAKDAALVRGYVVAYEPVVNDGLCKAQALANTAGAIAAASGDAAAAADASLASQAAGVGCLTLKPIVTTAPLPAPAAAPPS